MRRTLQITAAIAYLVAAIFTYAYVYQRVDCSEVSQLASKEERCFLPAFGAGLVWPIYWTTHYAFEWTAPEVRL